jgi:glycosyltransferase involved in cell wall biosynthesis
MRVAFDLRPAFRKNSRRRGIGTYTVQLFQALVNAGCDFGLTLIAYGCGGTEPELPEGRYEYRSLFQLPKPSRLAWLPDRLLLPRQLSKDAAQIFHANDITSIAFRSGIKTVVTVHDVIPLVFAEQMKRSIPWDYWLALKDGFRRIPRVDLVVTDSSYSKSDISRRLQIDPEKIAVVYPGCSSSFAPVDPGLAKGRIAKAFGISRPFLFYVGGTDFRKNLACLVDAFADIRRSGYEGLLVMAGETFRWDIEEVRQLRQRIAGCGAEGSVVFPGFVTTEQLVDLYSACEAFVFPSLYEGFGLPVLEALRCGAAVMTTRVSSIPEVAGEAAAYFDPQDPSSLVRSFCDLMADPVRRDKLRKEGRARSAVFTWNQAARQLLSLYDSLLWS